MFSSADSADMSRSQMRVVPMGAIFGAIMESRGGSPCGGAWGSGPGAFVGLFVDLDWADFFAWLVVKRFAEKRKICRQVWNSHSPEARRRRECRQFPKDMLQPRP